MAEKTYAINEIYYTIHGEGVRYGMPHVFVRFSGCNLTCSFCDTEYESGRRMTAAEVVAATAAEADANYAKPVPVDVAGAKAHGHYVDAGPCRDVLLCGGEPLLQLDVELVAAFKAAGWHISIETNGAIREPEGIDWITCSPKVAEHAIRLTRADELKYVRGKGQGIPRPALKAAHHLISPVFDGDAVDPATLRWCVELVKANPAWRLTMQHHKVAFGGVR